MILSDHLPYEFKGGEYHDTPAWKLRDVIAVKTYQNSFGQKWKSWPGKHKNVHFWVVLENGKAVGMNEGPQGWSFPVISYKEG